MGKESKNTENEDRSRKKKEGLEEIKKERNGERGKEREIKKREVIKK
jgi:hypothetical protein